MKIIKKLAAFFAALVMMTGIVVAQDSTDTEPEIDPEIQKIHEKYQAEYKKLQDHGERLSDEAPKGAENATGIDVDLSKWHTVTFEIPEFRMNIKKLIFDVPEVAVRIKKLIFSVPTTKMVRVQIGVKPEFKGLKMKMTPIYVSRPEIRMERREAKINIPEFKMKRVEALVKIPEIFRSKQVSFRVPEIKVRSTEEATGEVETEADEIKKVTDSLVAAETTEIKALSRKRLTEARQSVEEQYKTTVAQFTSAIEEASKSGADPTKLSGEDGVTMNLPEQLAESSKGFTSALEQIDAALADLDKP